MKEFEKKNPTDICCIFNYYSFYRKVIYEMMDKELGCDFYIGEKYVTPLKKADAYELKGFKGYLNVTFGIIHRFKGAHRAVMNRQYKYYIALGDPYCLSIWWLLIWSKITGKKTIFWSHGWYRDGNLIQNMFYHIFWRLTDHALLYGNYARNHMIQKGINPEKLTCIYNSLDYDAEVKRRNTETENIINKHFGNNYPVLFFVGRLIEGKQLDKIITAMRIIEDKYEMKVNCVLIGDGPCKETIEKQVHINKLQERVWFYGACYDEDELSQLIKHCDVCVSPGNIGLTVMHSLTYGAPVITGDDFDHQGPEFEAIQPGNTGAFYKQGDIEDLAKTIYGWLSKVPEREMLRQNCYKIIDNYYNPHKQIETIKNVLIKVGC